MLVERNLKNRETASTTRSKLITGLSNPPNDANGSKAKQNLKVYGKLTSEVNELKQKSISLPSKQSRMPNALPRNGEGHQNFTHSKQNTTKITSSKQINFKQSGSRYTMISEQPKDAVQPTISRAVIVETSVDRSEMDDNPSCAQAVSEVQHVWDKFVAVSAAINRLECLMVQTKIEHVLNNEYEVYYQRHPYATDPVTTKQNDDFEKSKSFMDDLKVKIMMTKELEERIASLSRAHEILQSEMNVLINNSKTTASSLRGRSSLERAASTAIREKLAKITYEEKTKKDKINFCTTELDTLEKELAELLQDSHPIYSSLFCHPDETRNPVAADEERKYLSMIRALQERGAGFMSPTRQQSMESQDSDCDADWQWLIQFSGSVSSNGKSAVNNRMSFSDDLSSALQQGRSNFEQTYLVGVDITCSDLLTSETGYIDLEDIISGKSVDIERSHGEPSLLFLRRLRCRCFHIHKHLHTLRQVLTTKLTILQECKPCDRPITSTALNSFRSPTDSTVLSFATIYQNDDQGPPSYSKANLKVPVNLQRAGRLRQPPQSPTRKLDGKVDSKTKTSVTTPTSTEKPSILENSKVMAQRSKPPGFLDPTSFLSTRKNNILSSRSFGNRSRSIDAVEADRMAIVSVVSPVLSPPVRSSERPASPIELLKEMIHNSATKKQLLQTTTSSSSANDEFAKSSKAALGLFFDYEDLDELNQLILKYLADKRSMSASVDPAESAADFNEVLKSVKVKVLSDLLKRDLAIADELQACQVQLLTIPETVDYPDPAVDEMTSENVSKIQKTSGDSKQSPILPQRSMASPSSGSRSRHKEPKVTLLEQFKIAGEMICVDSEDVPPDETNNQTSERSQESELSTSKGSKSTQVSISLDTIYKCESYNEFIDAITQHELNSEPFPSVSQSRPAKKLFDNNDCTNESGNIDVIKYKLNKMHQSSHKKKANPVVSSHSARSSCLICTHLPQIFGNFSETCTPLGNNNPVQTPPRTRDSNIFISEEYNVLAQGSLTKPGVNAAGERDDAVASITTNKIIVSFNGTKPFSTPPKNSTIGASKQEGSASKRGGSSATSPKEKTKNSYVTNNVKSPPTIKERISASTVKLQDKSNINAPNSVAKPANELKDFPTINSDGKSTAMLTYYSPSLNPLSRLNNGMNHSPNKKSSVTFDLQVPNTANDCPLVEETLNSNPKSYLSVMAGKSFSNAASFHDISDTSPIDLELNNKIQQPSCKDGSEFSESSNDDKYLSNDNYVSPPSEIVNLSVSMSMDTSLRQPLFSQQTPAMTKSILKQNPKLDIESSQIDNPMHINENELSSIKLYDTLQKMHVKYFCRRKRNGSASKSALDDIEIEYSSPILLKNEFIDRILFGNGEKSSSEVKKFHCSSDDMSTSLEEEDLAELSNLLSSYGNTNAAAEKTHIPSALAALKLFATRKKEMALSLRHWKDSKYKTGIEDKEEQKTEKLLPCRSVTNSSSNGGSAIDGNSSSPQSTSISSISSDSISLTNLMITKEIKRNNSNNRDSRQKNEMELQSVMEKLAKLKSELSRSSSSNSSRNGTPIKNSTASMSQSSSPVLESPPPIPMTSTEELVSAPFPTTEELNLQAEVNKHVEANQPTSFTDSVRTDYSYEETRCIPSIADTKAAVADEINLFLLDYLSKQQREIDELKRTQDTINDLLLQRRDITSTNTKESPVGAYSGNKFVEVDSNIYTVKEFHDSTDVYSEDSMLIASQFASTVIPEDTDNETLTPALPVDEEILTIEVPDVAMPCKNSHEFEPSHEIEVNAIKDEWPTQHCRRPSATDSVMSALTNSTGLSSAPPLPGSQKDVVVSEMKIMPTPPQQLQRLRFQSFLEAAQGYSPNYKFNNKFNYSPNFNTSNFAANRELEEMVTFLGAKIDKCELKCTQLLGQEQLDPRTHTIAVDPLDGRSKAYVEVYVT